MRCPFCNNEDTQVKNSRTGEDGTSIRRRRICTKCDGRFTTYERIQMKELYVAKRDGEIEPFDRGKLEKSLEMAVRKRKVPGNIIYDIANKISRQLEESIESNIPSYVIGEMAMEALREHDLVAYVRFASVYKEFDTPEDFANFISKIPSA